MKTAEEILIEKFGEAPSTSILEKMADACREYAKQFENNWVMADILPKTRASYSELDYFVETKYRFTIGRTFKDNWVDMENRPIEDVVRYTNLPNPYNV